MELTVCRLSKKPSLRQEFSRIIRAGWPEFMLNDTMVKLYWDYLMTDLSEWQFAVKNDKNEVVAIGNSIPLYWDGTVEHLPLGLDDALERGIDGHKRSVAPNTLSALAIVIDPAHRGIGLSNFMINAMKALATEYKYNHYIDPLRPSMKAYYPLTDMSDYIKWLADDGNPFDPWLRSHIKMGAAILEVAPKSMVVKGTIIDWENWTKMRFIQNGQYVVSGALNPIEVDCHSNTATYTEPCVWVQHDLKR